VTSDLGKYADVVLSAYGGSLVMLVVIVVISLARGRRVRAEMRNIEKSRSKQ